jgi:L-ribulose-5-phosphate 3-epimerase UlaE
MLPPPTISKANQLKRNDWKKSRKSCLRSKLCQKAYRFKAIAITALQNYPLYLYKTRNDILHDGDEEREAIVNSA